MKLFVICGHGAGDPGACANGYEEAERVRALGKKIKELGGNNVMLGDVNRNFYEETASKYKDSPEYAKRLELARQAHLIFPKAKHVRDEVSRDHEDASMFKVYEYETEYGIVEFKCKVNNDGYFLHYMRLLKE